MEPYDAQKNEKRMRELWEKEKIYRFDTKKKGKIYSIDTPPPTLSGDMHAGHAFSYSQQDFIARFRRMFIAGKGQVFYPFGTDDNGLPTERLVEKLNNVKSKEMPRSEFIELCLKTLKRITPDFVQQWKNLGISADYGIYYSTIDKNSRKISQKSFLDLFKLGRIYRKEFPTIWCPECQTAIAQAELEDREIPSTFSIIKFHSGNHDLPIATTRPELLAACVAIFINPKDSRYRHLKGKIARVPLFNFEVPIIPDKSADPEKGTGAMMVCSYGDKYDVDAVVRYKLKPRIIFDKQGKLMSGRYNGLKIKEARRKILEDLKNAGLIIKQDQIVHAVNVHDKCGTEIEFLPTEQWFVKILDKKKELIAQGKKVAWFPKHMFKRYQNWVNGLEWDWIISRDRYFGVPIPIWKCAGCGEIILAEEKELPVDPTHVKKKCRKCGEEAIGESKVLDTWATSSLTPQIASSLVGNKIKIPFSLRPQAHDIIRTWAFYTIVKSLYHEKKLPWSNIMISGFATLGKEKMSKSKGIAVNPREIISEYGADALRFWAAGSKLGEDLEYQEKDVLAGKRFMTKLWNASNFVFMNLKNYKPKKPKKLLETDKIFLKELDHLIKDATDSFAEYNYSAVKLRVEKFFWRDFCDNYLEIVKWRVYNGNKEEKESAFYTLYISLLTILKLIAPIIPFITEYIYQKHFRKNENEKSIHLSKWTIPGADANLVSHIWPMFLKVIYKVRQEKSTAKKPMNSEIILTLGKGYYGKTHFLKIPNPERFSGMLEDLKRVTNAKEIKTGDFKVEFL